jgi:hypothetical protein
LGMAFERFAFIGETDLIRSLAIASFEQFL